MRYHMLNLYHRVRTDITYFITGFIDGFTSNFTEQDYELLTVVVFLIMCAIALGLGFLIGSLLVYPVRPDALR